MLDIHAFKPKAKVIIELAEEPNGVVPKMVKKS